MSKKGKPTQAIMIEVSGNTVWAHVANAYGQHLKCVAGYAKCHPNDTFDFYEGARIALARAFGKDPFPKTDDAEKPSVEKPEEKTGSIVHPKLGRGRWVQAENGKTGNPGDWILIGRPWMSKDLYKTGDILEIVDTRVCGCFANIPGYGKKYIADHEYTIWVPDEPGDKTDVIVHPTLGRGRWVKAGNGKNGKPGDWIRIDKAWIPTGYQSGDILKISELSNFGCRAIVPGYGKKYIADKEYSIWAPEEPEQKAPTKEEPKPMEPNFQVGDIVRTGDSHPFVSSCRNCIARVTAVEGVKNYTIYKLSVKKSTGVLAVQSCVQYRNRPAPLTLLWREEK